MLKKKDGAVSLCPLTCRYIVAFGLLVVLIALEVVLFNPHMMGLLQGSLIAIAVVVTTFGAASFASSPAAPSDTSPAVSSVASQGMDEQSSNGATPPPRRCQFQGCKKAVVSLPDGPSLDYCRAHWSLASLPEQTVFREIAARHLLAIQEYWARTNIQMAIQIGLLSAFAILAATEESRQPELLAILGIAGILMSYIGALIITRSLYLMRCWEEAAFDAEAALGQELYASSTKAIYQQDRNRVALSKWQPEDLFIRRLKSSVLATTFPWAFAVAWPALVLTLFEAWGLVEKWQLFVGAMWVVLNFSTALVVCYFCLWGLIRPINSRLSNANS